MNCFVKKLSYKLHANAILFGMAALATPSFAAPSLGWQAPTTNADATPLTDLAGYKVKRSTVAGNYANATVNTLAASSTTFELQNLSVGVQYFFVVTAFDTSGNESIASNEVNFTPSSNGGGGDEPLPPAPPPNDDPSNPDDDGDGSADNEDNCPSISNPDQADSDQDGIGNLCQDKGQVPFDLDGDKKSDLLLTNNKSFQGFSSILDPSVVVQFSGTLGKGVYGAGDVNSDGTTEIVLGSPTTKGIRWYASKSDGSAKTDLKFFGSKSDTPVVGCQVKGKMLPAVLHKASSKTQFLLKGKKAATLKSPATGLFCSKSKDSRLIGLEKSGKVYYAVVMSLAGQLKSRVLVPSGLTSSQLVSVPPFGARKEQVVLIAKRKSVTELYRLNESKKRFDKITLPTALGNVTGVMSGVLYSNYGFIGVAKGTSFSIVTVDGTTKVIDLPQLTLPAGYKVVK